MSHFFFSPFMVTDYLPRWPKRPYDFSTVWLLASYDGGQFSNSQSVLVLLGKVHGWSPNHHRPSI
jgi:hypothetical protein